MRSRSLGWWLDTSNKCCHLLYTVFESSIYAALLAPLTTEKQVLTMECQLELGSLRKELQSKSAAEYMLRQQAPDLASDLASDLAKHRLLEVLPYCADFAHCCYQWIGVAEF